MFLKALLFSHMPRMLLWAIIPVGVMAYMGILTNVLIGGLVGACLGCVFGYNSGIWDAIHTIQDLLVDYRKGKRDEPK